MVRTNLGQYFKRDQVFYDNLRQLQQATLETMIQVVLISLVIWYFMANLMGEEINLPQLTISLIPVVAGSWWALRQLGKRLACKVLLNT
jgi:hypothetical protein